MFLVGLIFNLFFFSFVHLLGQFFVNLKSYVHQKRNLGFEDSMLNQCYFGGNHHINFPQNPP